MDRVSAAVKGIKEIGFAVVAMTLTLTAVYAPLAFATGRTGRLFIEFALALAGAVLVSGFVALTLSPMMCSKLLKHEPKHGKVFTTDRRLARRPHARLCALARLGARPALDRRHRLGSRGRPRWAVLLAAAFGAGTAGGPRRDLRTAAVAAGLDRRVHLRAAARGRELLRHDSGGGGLQRDRRFSDRRLWQCNSPAEALGRAHTQAAGHRARTEREVLRSCRA